MFLNIKGKIFNYFKIQILQNRLDKKRKKERKKEKKKKKCHQDSADIVLAASHISDVAISYSFNNYKNRKKNRKRKWR